MPSNDPLLGRPDKTAWRSYQIKGNLLAARARYVRETWGEAAVAAVAGQLTGDLRATFEGSILPFAWYPFPTMAEIDRAIVAGPMGGQMALMKRFGSTIARYDLRGPNRLVSDRPTIHEMLALRRAATRAGSRPAR